jgi:hypothetical protein
MKNMFMSLRDDMDKTFVWEETIKTRMVFVYVFKYYKNA